MPSPVDGALYERVKSEIYREVPKHSAYRSGLVVQEYKRRGGRYVGKKDPSDGLSRWFREKWRNQRGGVGYKKSGDVYRPTVRVTKETPRTFGELTIGELKTAQKKKRTVGRVDKF